MRTQPYTDSELISHLIAGTDEQHIDTLRDHIRLNGKVKASILLAYTKCSTVDECVSYLKVIQS